MSNNRTSLNINVLYIAIAAIVVAAIGYALKDSFGVQLRLFGALFWLSVTAIAFIFVLLYFAQYITPLGGNEGWWQGWYLMVRAYFTAPAPGARLPGNGTESSKQRRSRKKTARQAQEELPPSFKSLKAGLLRPYQVLAITKGKQYIGPKGPGFILLGRKEKVRKIVDLRKQSRSQPIKTTTRDGIQIEATITVEFQVAQPQTRINERILYPYERDAIFFIAYADTIDEKGNLQSWTSQIVAKAAALALPALNRYTLNNLILPASGVSVIGDIAENIKKELIRNYRTHHIDILQVKIVPTIPDEIREQQIKQFIAEWQHKMEIKQNAGHAEANRRLKQARARAQIDIIETIARSIDTMRQENDADMAQIITLRMIEALEEAVSEGSIQAMVPQQIMASLVADTSRQMKTWGRDVPPPQISARYGKEK